MKKIIIFLIWHLLLLVNFITYILFIIIGKELYINLSLVLTFIIVPILIIIAFFQGKENFEKIIKYYEWVKKYLKFISIYGSFILVLIIPQLFVGSAPTTAYHGMTFIDFTDYIFFPIWIFAIIYLILLKILVFFINIKKKNSKSEILEEKKNIEL